MHLLVVEDDPRLADLIARLLTGERHLVEVAGSGSAALEMAATEGLDAIVLDVGLPDMSGFDVARRLREGRNRTPILMLTARDAVADRVSGLDSGADDYLVKPFAFEELSARLRALGRRGTDLRDVGSIRVGGVAIDDVARSVRVDGVPVDLSPREFAMLECLIRHRGQVLTRDQLLDHAWPYGADVALGIVDTYVYFLRRKLGPVAGGLIETVRGLGYRLARE
jgi:two-component system OmpR family response regulator